MGQKCSCFEMETDTNTILCDKNKEDNYSETFFNAKNKQKTEEYLTLTRREKNLSNADLTYYQKTETFTKDQNVIYEKTTKTPENIFYKLELIFNNLLIKKFYQNFKDIFISLNELDFQNCLTSIEIQKIISLEKKIKSTFSHEGWKNYYSSDPNFYNSNKNNFENKKKIFFEDKKNSNETTQEKEYIYEGQMNEMYQKSGRGVLYYLDGLSKEEGSWNNDQLNGWCRVIFSNSMVMDGKISLFIKGFYKNGIIDGKGKFYNIEETLKYEGDFVNGKKEGKGTEITEDIKYEGEFKCNKRNGLGKIEFLKSGDIFEGKFLENKMNEGIFIWKNTQNSFKGSFVNNKMDGYGIFTTSTGQIYKGNYKEGKKDGQGLIIENEKIIYEGQFKAGNPDGKGNIYDKYGVKKEVMMDNGKKINENNRITQPKQIGLSN